MWIRSAALLGAVAASTLVTAACSDGGASEGGAEVIASSYPFAFVAERVAGNQLGVENLTQPGAEPHDIELDPQQVAHLADASLVIYEHGFQPAVDDAIEQAGLADSATLDIADVVSLVPAAQHGGADDTDTSGDLDPHVWLDPVAMQQIATAVADRLVELGPDHKPVYERNLDRLLGELRRLDADYRRGLAHCERRTIVTSHDAFGYLADRYGLEQIPIAGLDPHNEPSPAQQAEIADLVRRDGITTVFTETLVSDDVAQSIADETGVTVATLDPIEGLSDDTSNATYLSLMRANLDALRQANGCT